MSSAKHSSDHPVLQLIGTAFRVWAVGFVLAANGTLWLARKTLRFLPFMRSKHTDESLIE